MAFEYLVTAYGEAELKSITVDQAADATTDVESFLRPTWKNLTINYSLWHKVFFISIFYYFSFLCISIWMYLLLFLILIFIC